MKKIIIFFIIVSFPTVLSSQELTPDEEKQILDVCSEWDSWAERLMRERQNNVSFADMMRVNRLAYEDTKNEYWYGAINFMIEEAFEIELMVSKVGKGKAIQDFRNKVFGDCLTLSRKIFLRDKN